MKAVFQLWVYDREQGGWYMAGFYADKDEALVARKEIWGESCPARREPSDYHIIQLRDVT